MKFLGKDIWNEEEFLEWLSFIIDINTNYPYELDEIPESISERLELLKFIQVTISEEDFKTIIAYADNECECTNVLKCSFCKIYEITEGITTQMYLDVELIEIEMLESLS
ncbi:MAG: hypothetical protein OEY49_16850 [Candidatus Heimdallarchaeota archaeon]|nr:hypothetical protein [Candidatus Heimdallarchaeota archaeon]